MRRRNVGLLAGVAAVTTIFVVFHRVLIVLPTVCLLALGAALSSSFYYLQDLGLDHSSPSVKRGIELREETRKLAAQDNGSGNIDDIVSAYFPPGTSVQDAITILKAAHASIEGPRLFSTARPDGKTTEWFGVRACIFFGSIAGGPQAWFILETDQPNPTIITRARGSIMSVYL